MSVNQNMIFLPETDEFTPEKAEFIALEIAQGTSLIDIHQACPERCPNPIVVNRWRRKYPAFDILMGEAEVAVAQKLAWETIGISDGDDVAAKATNRIKARQWLASKLDQKYAPNATVETKLTLDKEVHELSDEQLMQIASQGREPIEGESERVEEAVAEDPVGSEKGDVEASARAGGRDEPPPAPPDEFPGRMRVADEPDAAEGSERSGGWDFLNA